MIVSIPDLSNDHHIAWSVRLFFKLVLRLIFNIFFEKDLLVFKVVSCYSCTMYIQKSTPIIYSKIQF